MTKLGKKIGSFVSGSFVKLILRQKSNEEFELGQLFVAGRDMSDYSIYQIKDLYYGSQIPDNSLELIAGYGLEREDIDLKIYEPELRNYVLAQAKPLIKVKNLQLFLPKKLPQFFGNLFEIEEKHLQFFKEKKFDDPITLGKVRSGSKILDIDVNVSASEVIRHHVLIPATTGRGKSNLVKVILYNIVENLSCGKLVFDPHNEYYGTPKIKGLKDHPKSSDYVIYYTLRDIQRKLDLKFNVQYLYPSHVLGSIDLSQPQSDALITYFRKFKKEWIQKIFDENIEYNKFGIKDTTIDVLRRKLTLLLDLDFDDEGNIIEKGIFSLSGYESTIEDIINFLINGKTVIIDSSLFSGNEEIFIATIIVESIFNRYKHYKFKDELEDKPVIAIILEEAPRVIGIKALEVRENVFGKIAREGRKFKIGLVGITQLPSLIPREILANMNTKIILGNEMGPERRVLIEGSAQDLSDDSQTIASLDIGEAIVTSNFTKFAIPIKIPLFDDLIKNTLHSEKKIKKVSPGFSLE